MINNPAITTTIMSNKKLISLPYLGQILSLFSYFTSFNNDYWYYLYHNRNISSMPYSRIFFEIITVINNGKMIPFFLNQTSIDNQIYSFAKTIFSSDFTNYTNSYVMKVDSQPTYFIYNIESMLVWNYGTNLIVFFSFSLMYFLAFSGIKYFAKFKNIRKSFLLQNKALFLLINFFRINSLK